MARNVRDVSRVSADFPTTNIEESNLRLRALWSTLRAQFGKAAWQYSPHRVGKELAVELGWVDIGPAILSVRLELETKSCLRAIHVDVAGTDASINTRIRAAIEAAQSAVPSKQRGVVGVESPCGSLHAYRGERVALWPTGQRTFDLSMTIGAFDPIDARSELQRALPIALGLLAIETNGYFLVAKRTASVEPPDDLNWNVYAPDSDWIDDYPLVDGKLAISGAGFDLLQKSCEEVRNEAIRGIMRCAPIFHAARKLDAIAQEAMSDGRLSAAASIVDLPADAAMTLYLSATEAAALHLQTREHCAACGQVKRSIKSTVAQFVSERGGARIVGQIRSFYDDRSGFLHAGRVTAFPAYAGVSIPLLDPSMANLMEWSHGPPLKSIREYLSHALRAQIPIALTAV